mgnify:CR=1 FL=1
MEPFVWRIKLAHNISLDEAIKMFEGRQCLMCGRVIPRPERRRGRPRRFCSKICLSRYKEFERSRQEILSLEVDSEESQELGTIYIRPKVHNETWQQYHRYLQSLKPWIIR